MIAVRENQIKDGLYGSPSLILKDVKDLKNLKHIVESHRRDVYKTCKYFKINVSSKTFTYINCCIK